MIIKNLLLNVNKIITKKSNPIAKISLFDSMKMLLYKEYPDVFDQLDLDNYEVFQEPLLFAFFNNREGHKADRDILLEILQGYDFLSAKELSIKHSYNQNDIAYIPNKGYYKRGELELIEPILKVGPLEIVKEIHPLLNKYMTETYRGHVLNENPAHQSVWKKYSNELFKSIEIIRKYLPEFYQELILANKKIYLHDNATILNFTSIETLGMLYLYVYDDDPLVYFIEELIHQGSHNYLYHLLQNSKDFFKIDAAEITMRELTEETWDYRSVYDAFHGLYTVTRRMQCFDQLINENVFEGRYKHELLGRFTDQLSRLKTGVELLEHEKVFTKSGLAMYRKLEATSDRLYKKYEFLKSAFDLSHRDLDFRYDEFCRDNPLEEFYLVKP